MSAVEQPSGTVTLVFTDIEGSTRLLEELGIEAYREALEAHRQAIRSAFGRYRGYEVSYEGDSFFFALTTADGALSAARDALAALEPGPIRVRVGIHTGRPGLDPPKYVGLDVHRAARIMASAHGGQIVMSRTTADALAGASDLTDLGEHWFKDIAEPERVFQVGGHAFPPLRSLFRTTLPVSPTAFLGRADELAAVDDLLDRREARLVTLLGPGGTGKTRLALECATRASHRFPDGITWVALAPLREPDIVVPTIARALSIEEQADTRLADVVAAELLGKQALLVVDNAEHLMPDVANELGALLSACPTLRILATSRERLNIAGETVWGVPTLDPADSQRLLLSRARAAGVELTPDATTAELCRRLDHLPLAIELAAARLTLLTPDELLARLGQRLDLLAGPRDGDQRQQTLRAAIDWSYELLSDAEQRAYQGFSVLAGGATLAGFEAVCAADPETLLSLVDKSLVLRTADGPTSRYSMLETVRHHASSLLDPKEERETVERAFTYLEALLTSFDDESNYSDSRSWAPAFRAEETTILGILVEAQRLGLVGEALELAILASGPWHDLGALDLAASQLESTLAQPETTGHPLRPRALRSLARLDDKRGRWDEAVRRSTEAIALAAELGDREEECIANGNLGAFHWSAGDMERARVFLDRSLALAEDLGDELEIARASYNLANVLLELDGSFGNALPLYEQSYEAVRRLGHVPGTIICLGAIGEARCECGDHLGALEALRDCLALADETQHEVHVPGVLESLAKTAVAVGARADAARLVDAADALRDRQGSVVETTRVESQRRLRDSLADEQDRGGPALDVRECLTVATRLALQAQALDTA